MGQPITDHAAFFASAGQAVEELEALNTEVEQLEADEKKLESSLKGKQRSVTETISQTVKQRKEEITKSYDAELGKAQERLKKVKAKREKAKNQGVKERIEEDTRGLVRENKELADQIKTLFKAMSQKEEIFEYTYKKVPYKILVNKIRYFESDKRQVNLYSTDGVSSFYKKLDEVEAQLEQMNIKFLRISKSYLVNVNYVKEFRYEKVVMDDGKEFKIGPRYKDKIRKSYIELMRIS